MTITKLAPSILVTGGAGFIGAHVCAALYEAGFLPVVLDTLSSGFEDFVKWGPFYQGNCGNQSLVQQIVEAHRPVACIHFAGLIEVGRSVIDPQRFYRENVAASIDLMDILRDSGVNTVVFSSSAAVYQTRPEPLFESDALSPESPYGRTKLMVEQLLADMSLAYGTRYAALRYFNAAGGQSDLGIGESHFPETHLIPSILDFAYGRRPSFTVFGDDYPTVDGTCIRDYIHVQDLASAHVLALQYLLDGGDSVALNVGTGRGHSVREVITVATDVVGRPILPQFGPRRMGDAPMLVANCDLIQSLLGWTPMASDLQTIVADAWRWRGHHNLYLDRRGAL